MWRHPERIRGRALGTGAAAAAAVAVMLGVGADQALADVSAQVDAAGTLRIDGDSAANKLFLEVDPGSPTRLARRSSTVTRRARRAPARPSTPTH